MRWISFVPSALLVVVAGCAPNRQAAPEAIPVPLVSALISDASSPNRTSFKYSVGQLPAGYPAVLVPSAPAKIVGGMTARNQTVAVFADSTRRLAAVMEQVFEQHGYIRPQPTSGSGFSSGSGPYSFFCGDSGMVSVEPLAGSNRGSVRVVYHPVQWSVYCPKHESAPLAVELTLPELKPPTDVSVSRPHGAHGGDGVNSEAEMAGENLSPSAIVAHYSSQLISAGWTADAPAVGQQVAAQYFYAKDTTGRSWEGVLMASGGKTALTLSLSMRPSASR